MRKVWGRASSSNVMKVVWLLEELGERYERIDVGGPFGRTHDPDYLAMNPNSKVPTLQEGEFTLWESNAILRYLAGQYATGPLWPAQAQARAKVDQWLDWQQTTLNAPQSVVFQGLIRTAPEARDVAAIAAATEQAAAAWTMLDHQLTTHHYVAGPDFGLADIALGVHVHRWFAFAFDKPETLHLRAWYDRLLARPAYRTHCAGPLI